MLCCRHFRGPIPARAGEPKSSPARRSSSRAYPRSRGGTTLSAASPPSSWGLSPLARGNHKLAIQVSAQQGPIPARAGEPPRQKPGRSLSRAYPRSRGGTRFCQVQGHVEQGLSPLARGNRDEAVELVCFRGPIPARAGEPVSKPSRPSPAWAYPRSRGGTAVWGVAEAAESGLSPLARGNRSSGRGGQLHLGPIPARAGEPPMKLLRLALAWAYPRSRGGTKPLVGIHAPIRGLSPLARGNLFRALSNSAPKGPIPARAGEPLQPWAGASARRAYPRSRGGTAVADVADSSTLGLSPLARGNLPLQPDD